MMNAGMSTLGSGIGQSAGNAFSAGGTAIGIVGDRIANEKRMNRQQEAMQSAIDSGNATYEELQAMYQPDVEGGQRAYGELWGEYDALKNQAPVKQFGAGDVDQWLDPSLDYQAKMAQRALGAQQGGSGDYLSSSGMQQMMENNRQIGEQGWGDARNFGYQQYKDKIANDRTDLSNRVNLLNNFNQQGQSALNNTANAKMRYGDQANSLALSKGMLNAEQSTLPSQMWSGLGQTGMELGASDSQVFGNMVGSMGGGQPVQGADPQMIGRSQQGQGMISGGNTGQQAPQGNMMSSFGTPQPTQNSWNSNLDTTRDAGYNLKV